MSKRTLETLIAHVFLMGCTTVAFVWTALDHVYNDGSLWMPIVNALIWSVALCGAVLCYLELRDIEAGRSEASLKQKDECLKPNC